MFYHHDWQNQSWTWPTTINMQIWRGMKEESTNINATQSLQRYFYSICKYIHRYVIYIHIHVWVLLQCLTLLVNYPNNGYLVTEVQEPTSCLFQAKYHRWTFSVCWNPKELYSNFSEGMNVQAIVRGNMQRTRPSLLPVLFILC